MGLVGVRVSAQATAWLSLVDRLSEGELDDVLVHDLRLASRRLRSALATYGDLVLGERAEPIRRELGWFAGLLGALRDPAVARDRLDGLLEGEHRLSASVMAGVDARYRAVGDGAGVAVRVAMMSSRFTELTESVRGLATEDLSDVPEAELLNRVLTDWHRLSALAGVAQGSPPDLDTALHDVRKAAKRLHDALVTLAPARPEARRWAKRLAVLVALLGRRQDALVSRQQLHVMAAAMGDDPEATFAFGRLDAQEEARLESLDAEWPEAWRNATRPKLRKWLG